MRRLMIVALAVLIGLAPVAAGVASAQTQTQAQTPVRAAYDPVYPLVLAAGGLAGVVGFTLLSSGVWWTLPLAGVSGQLSSAPPGVVGVSRVYAVASAVVGVWIFNWFYTGK